MSRGSHSPFARVRGAIAWALLVPAFAWCAGQIASDRWWWSQWLFWIPPAVPLACALAAVGVSLRAGSRAASAPVRSTQRAGGARGIWASRRLVALRAIACAAAVATGAATLQWMSWGRWTLAVEPASRSALRIVHLNPRWPGDATDLAAAMMAQSADVYAISEAGAVLRAPAVREAEHAGAVTLHVGRFAIVSRCPVREARAVYDDGSTAASWVRFGATDGLPEWTMLMVDAPRRLRVSRREIFTALRAALDAMSLGTPDVVVGDMNTTPGSRAVSDAWPSLRDASQEAGRGVRGTFPRELPLWAIDRCLLTPKWRIIEWRSWDPGRGAHRGQRIEIDVRPVSP